MASTSKRTRITVTIVLAVVILICFLFYATLGMLALFFVSDPGGLDPFTHLLPYDMVLSFQLYHHIQYNGVDYYLMNNTGDIPDEIDEAGFNTDGVYVTLVDKNGKPYDKNRKEEAWLLNNDTEAMYLYFLAGSVEYTKDKSLACVSYRFDE